MEIFEIEKELEELETEKNGLQMALDLITVNGYISVCEMIIQNRIVEINQKIKELKQDLFMEILIGSMFED
jgi:hypothetical protein